MDQTVTPDLILKSIGILLAFAAAVVSIDKLIDVIKKWRKPREQTDQTLVQCQIDLQAQKAIADAQAEEIRILGAGLIVTCKGVKALLEHELHNGNTGEMVSASKAIDDWLFSK